MFNVLVNLELNDIPVLSSVCILHFFMSSFIFLSKTVWLSSYRSCTFLKFILRHFIPLVEIVNGKFLHYISQLLLFKHGKVTVFCIIYFVTDCITEISSLALIKFTLKLCPYFKVLIICLRYWHNFRGLTLNHIPKGN